MCKLSQYGSDCSDPYTSLLQLDGGDRRDGGSRGGEVTDIRLKLDLANEEDPKVFKIRK